MKIPFELIAVFDAPELGFRGNISTVVMLEAPLDDEKMQAIAADFNQPATTFLWRAEEENSYHVRWFAPDAEIDLCGHGSLAAMAFLHKHHSENIRLLYQRGRIEGKSEGSAHFTMDLDPIPVVKEVEISQLLQQGLGVHIQAHYQTSNKNIVLLENEADLRRMRPDFAKLRESDIFGYAVTAPGDEADFVSRTLVPHVQQLEDHATGSSHAALAPFWSKHLGKEELSAWQLSRRGGKFSCRYRAGKVTLSGHASFLAGGKLRM
ncbi:MAG: PhzF family phenazine biosynthesis protein [Cyclobacteriaceae bacterium]